VTASDDTIAECTGTGQATLINMLTGQISPLGQNVWSLNTTERADALLVASTSVRILDIRDVGPAKLIGAGTRLTRDADGGIAALHEAPAWIMYYTDPGMEFVRKVDAPLGLRLGFPYNGRWRLTFDRATKSGLFTDSDGREPPLSLSPMPVNYSCGDSRDSLVVLQRGGHHLDHLDSHTGKILWSYEVPDAVVSGLWVTPNGESALVLAGDTELLAIDVKTGKLKTTLRGHNVRIANLAFTRDRKHFFTCGADGRVILWDIATLQRGQEFRGNVAQRMSCADLSPDGTRVVTCNFTGYWQLWDAKSAMQLLDIRGSALPLRSILFSADGRSVITSGEDQHVRRWTSLDKDPSVRIPVAAEMLKGIKR